MDVQHFKGCFSRTCCCSGSSVSLWYVGTWHTDRLQPFHTPNLLLSITSTWTPSPHNILHVDMFSTLTCFTWCSLRLPSLSLSLFFSSSPWPQLAAFGKQERRWKRAIVGKCSFLSGMTQAAAVISTVIVGHHQRASITPARPWHRQQVPALPARLAPTWLWKPSDIQKGTDLHWMHHWINTADYQLTYTVLYRTE